MIGEVSSFFSFLAQPNLKMKTAKTVLLVNSDVEAHLDYMYMLRVYVYHDES